jgi:hypothetical protein
MPRARKYEGVVYRRAGTEIWWIRYRDRNGIARRESSLTADWQEASKKLRERLQARDDNLLEVVRKGGTLGFRAMGGFLLGELFQIARARRENARSERAVCKTL